MLNRNAFDPTAVTIEDFHSAVGQVSVAWANFERALDVAIWHGLGVPDHLGVCVTDRLGSVFARLDTLAALAAQSGASETACAGLARFASEIVAVSARTSKSAACASLFAKRHGVEETDGQRRLMGSLQSEAVDNLFRTIETIDARRHQFASLWRAIGMEIAALPIRVRASGNDTLL